MTGLVNTEQTIESFYILWKTTGDTRWRERGWTLFKNIERETWTESGYASIEFVDTSPSPMRDEMPRYTYISLAPLSPALTATQIQLFFGRDLEIPLPPVQRR